jgi:hypothetical protein
MLITKPGAFVWSTISEDVEGMLRFGIDKLDWYMCQTKHVNGIWGNLAEAGD